MGICGVVDGRSVRVGNMMLMQKAAPEYDFFKLQTLEDMYLPQGASICYVCVENSVLGAIVVSDCVRGDARQAINKLQRRHLTVGMLTGKIWDSSSGRRDNLHKASLWFAACISASKTAKLNAES